MAKLLKYLKNSTKQFQIYVSRYDPAGHDDSDIQINLMAHVIAI